jgi:hypothetical protein
VKLTEPQKKIKNKNGNNKAGRQDKLNLHVNQNILLK